MDLKLNDKVYIATDDDVVHSAIVYGSEEPSDEIQLKLDNGFIGWFHKSEVHQYMEDAEQDVMDKYKSNVQEYNP